MKESYIGERKCYSWNTNTCIYENSNSLKSVADTSVNKWYENVIAMNNLSTKKTNTITPKVKSTASINCHSKKVRDIFCKSYILHTVLLIMITLLIAVSICCCLIKYLAKHLLPFNKR